MKKKRKNILLIAGMLLALLVGILAYSAYTQKQVYQESTANLLSTYGQSAKTFTMFAQRNWNILTGTAIWAPLRSGESRRDSGRSISPKRLHGSTRIFTCSTSSASFGPPPGGRARQSI